VALVTLYLFAHQPHRLRDYPERRRMDERSPEELYDHLYEEWFNEEVFRRVARECYWPTTTLLLHLVQEQAQRRKPFKLNFALSGLFLEQARRWEPKLLDVFRQLAATGLVEFTGETFYHSLSSLFGVDRTEFCAQVELHAQAITALTGQRPTFFRNTECLYNNDIAEAVQGLGFRGILTEGIERVLDGWRSPNFLYQSTTGLPVLLRDYQSSDDIGYRFSNRAWDFWPLHADVFARWMAANPHQIITLAMDYEAFGNHMWAADGIFDFLSWLPREVAHHPGLEWVTATEAVQRLQPVGVINVGPYDSVSWADAERDTSAWLGNTMQRWCFEEVKRLGPEVLATADPTLIRIWRQLQTSDHFYYMTNKSGSDQDVHHYFSVYRTPTEAFVRVQTALAAVSSYLERHKAGTSASLASK
jgi:alpha-amylase